MPELFLIPQSEFARVQSNVAEPFRQAELIAAMARYNAFTAVKRAGSGHLGSSFSAMEVVTWLYLQEMNTLTVGIDHPGRDIFFSSKGHDVPGLYALLTGLGVLTEAQLMKLRRYGGLDGHPDVGTRGIEANSGSLGMGISKGRGIAWAKQHQGLGGHVYVMVGDGEFQEGQNYEALQGASHHHQGGLTVIMDHNKIQTDKPICEIIDLGDLETKLRSFGWHVARCDGHDFAALQAVLAEFRGDPERPKFLIADTIKGKGIHFMEHPEALKANGGLYRWHAGAPDDETFAAGCEELLGSVNTLLEQQGMGRVSLIPAPIEETAAPAGSLHGEQEASVPNAPRVTKAGAEFVAAAYGEALLELAEECPQLVVLDGDLSADCRVRAFETRYPERFIENGIAEQDMVSMAGGMARHGLLPVVNSFASFLSARANEQIYNNAGERSRVIYVNHYGGLIPAGPGKSHQSIRDISLLASLPNFVIVQPANAEESRAATRWMVLQSDANCVLRLVIGPSPRRIELPDGYSFAPGRGCVLHEGDDALLFAYGPVMLHEALLAAERLASRGFGLRVINMPWLNRVDRCWLEEVAGGEAPIWVLEDHSPVGGLGDLLVNELHQAGLLGGRRFTKIGVEGLPACGTPPEALRHHGMDGASLAERIAPR